MFKKYQEIKKLETNNQRTAEKYKKERIRQKENKAEAKKLSNKFGNVTLKGEDLYNLSKVEARF